MESDNHRIGEGDRLRGGATMPVFYEFFAGGGMARAGLGPEWRCAFANEIDPKKAAVYTANWGNGELRVDDVARLKSSDLPGKADLAWASFPCQDLSLAGAGAGLNGNRSGTFWPFWRLIEALRMEGRAPRLVVLENVCGVLASHNGRDFVSISTALAEGYRFGFFVVNAVEFLPQSRPRLFIFGIEERARFPASLRSLDADPRWHSKALVAAFEKLDSATASKWIWWSLPEPHKLRAALSDFIEECPKGVSWHKDSETQKLISMMSPVNLEKLRKAQRVGGRVVGTIYKRTRLDEIGRKVQRAEIRFDGVAGCLRTPVGGSSRQLVMVIEGERVRSRLLSSREAARLMGLPDAYILPDNYNEGYRVAGDGVAVPVVRHLAKHLIEPALISSCAMEPAA